MGITKHFERKFLLGWGRHLWNIVGVSGFVAVLTGIILFGYSLTTQIPKSKSDFFGKDEFVSDEMIEKIDEMIITFNSSEYIPGSSGKLSYQEINKKTADLYSQRYELEQKIKTQNRDYGIYVEEVRSKNNIKLGQRVVSPFVTGYGLAVIASASVSTALLSIERNTRKY